MGLQMNESERALIRLETEVEGIKKQLLKIEADTISHKEFDPVRNIVFGAVGLMMATIIGAILALLLHTTK